MNIFKITFTIIKSIKVFSENIYSVCNFWCSIQWYTVNLVSLHWRSENLFFSNNTVIILGFNFSNTWFLQQYESQTNFRKPLYFLACSWVSPLWNGYWKRIIWLDKTNINSILLHLDKGGSIIMEPLKGHMSNYGPSAPKNLNLILLC